LPATYPGQSHQRFVEDVKQLLEALNHAGNVAAFIGIMAASGGVSGRSPEITRGNREGETEREATSRIQRATTVGGLYGLGAGAFFAATLLII